MDSGSKLLMRMIRFRPIRTEVLFVEVRPEDGAYELLMGYIPQAAMDRVGHRLVKVSRVDLK